MYQGSVEVAQFETKTWPRPLTVSPELSAHCLRAEGGAQSLSNSWGLGWVYTCSDFEYGAPLGFVEHPELCLGLSDGYPGAPDTRMAKTCVSSSPSVRSRS